MEKKTIYFIAVFLFGFLFWVFPQSIFAADLSISPQSSTYSVGDRAVLKVIVSSNTSVNAISSFVSVPPIFNIESVSKVGSMLNFWVTEPSYSASSRTISFEGVALSGFTGGNGTVLTINLRAINTGSGTVGFQAGKILANDGQGTDVTSSLNSATFTIIPAKNIPTKPEIPTKTAEKSMSTERSAEATLSAPIISPGEQDGLTAVVGTSLYPRSDILLTFVSINNSKVFIIGTADSKGSFSLIIPESLRSGQYSVTATVVLENGKHSPPSNILTIDLGGKFYGNISWKLGTYIGFILAALFFLLILYFLWKRFGPNKTRILIKKEVKEAEDVVHKSFALIKEDVGGKNMNSTLKNDLKEAENIIKKEIDDISHIPLNE